MKRKTLNRIVFLIFVIIFISSYYSVKHRQAPDKVSEKPGTVNPAAVDSLPAATTGDHSWWQVYFTDPATINDPADIRGSIAEKLISRIDSARRTIHIAAFEFNLTPIAEALIAAHRRGVEVRWVTDDEHGLEADTEEDHGQFAWLQKAGIEIKDDGRGALMHNKFWIFDQQIVWTGSTNITQNGMFRNNNNVIVIESADLAEIYEREFEEMWTAEEFGPTSTSTRDAQSVLVNGTPIQIFFAAEDDVAEQMIPMISKAEKSLHFMAFSFTHDGMGTAILDRFQNGVETKGIFETRGSETKYSELPHLYCAGVPVRQDGNPGTFHHKAIVIDAQTVITGSFNFSKNANQNNDENVLIVTNSAIAAKYLEEFDRRWAEAKDPDPADMNCK